GDPQRLALVTQHAADRRALGDAGREPGSEARGGRKLVGHHRSPPPRTLARASATQRAADAQREGDASEKYAESDPDQHPERRGVESVVREQAEDQARDDRAREDAPETDEVAAPQAVRTRVIGHPVRSVPGVLGKASTGAQLVGSQASAGGNVRKLS